MLDKVCKFN